MKKITVFILVILLFATIADIKAQERVPPSEGKALVYFIRSSGTGALVNFKYFDGENYLGKFSGQNYFSYECEPGHHVFWVTSENRDFIEANLLPNKVYMIEVIPTPGAIKSAVKLSPVSKSDLKSIKRINKLMAKKAPLKLQDKDFSKEGESLAFYIQNGMKKFNSDKEKGKLIKVLPANFYH